MKVMIVEDDPLISRLEEIRLASMGHEIAAVCRTGEEAVRAAGIKHPDVILMDINLAGDMDGISAGKEIHRLYSIPLVYLTSHTDSKTFHDAVAVGDCEYLVKPFTDLGLAIAIEMAVFKHRLCRQTHESFDFFSDVLGTVPAGVICTDRKGFISYLNPEAAALLLCTPSQDGSSHISEHLKIIHARDQSPMEDPVEKVISRNETFGFPSHSVLVRGRSQPGIPVFGAVAPLRKKDGAVTGAVILISQKTRISCFSFVSPGS